MHHLLQPGCQLKRDASGTSINLERVTLLREVGHCAMRCTRHGRGVAAWQRPSTYQPSHALHMHLHLTCVPSARPQRACRARRRELESLSKGASAEEVNRAKAMCEAAVHNALEASHIVAEDIGRQMITYGRRVPLDEFKQKVQARSPVRKRSREALIFYCCAWLSSRSPDENTDTIRVVGQRLPDLQFIATQHFATLAQSSSQWRQSERTRCRRSMRRRCSATAPRCSRASPRACCSATRQSCPSLTACHAASASRRWFVVHC
jgi:hypothetical protein